MNMNGFKPRSAEEARLQQEWIEKHIKAGGVVVVDEKTNAVIRVEYDNPIYQFYKQQYEEKIVLLEALDFALADLEGLAMNGEIPSYPPEIQKIKARVYGIRASA